MTSISSIDPYIKAAKSNITKALNELEHLARVNDNVDTTETISSFLNDINNDLDGLSNDLFDQAEIIDNCRNELGV